MSLKRRIKQYGGFTKSFTGEYLVEEDNYYVFLKVTHSNLPVASVYVNFKFKID